MGETDTNEKEIIQEETEEKTQPAEEILERLTSIDESLKDLKELFQGRIEHTSYEEKIVDRMHDELQDYKQDLYLKIMKPLINELIAINDSILKNAAYYKNEGNGDTVPLRFYEMHAYDMQDALANCNVDIFRNEEGDPFDPTRMQVIKKVKTPVKESDRTIAHIISSGYSYGNTLLSREKVEVFVYDPDAGADNTNSQES